MDEQQGLLMDEQQGLLKEFTAVRQALFEQALQG